MNVTGTMWIFLPATVVVGQFLETFEENPPCAHPPSSFGVEEALKALEQGLPRGRKVINDWAKLQLFC